MIIQPDTGYHVGLYIVERLVHSYADFAGNT